MRIVLVLVAFLLSLPLTGQAVDNQQAEQLNEFIVNYYKEPQPEKVTWAIQTICQMSEFKDPKKSFAVMMLTFYSSLLAADDSLLEQVFESINSSNDEMAKGFFLNVLWLTDFEQQRLSGKKKTIARKLFKKAAASWKSKKMRRFVKQLRKTAHFDIYSKPIKNASHIDMLWAAFFATGQSLPVERIISIIPEGKLADGEKVMPQAFVGLAAYWSLKTNALQHEKVYMICKEQHTMASVPIRNRLTELFQELSEKSTINMQ